MNKISKLCAAGVVALFAAGVQQASANTIAVYDYDGDPIDAYVYSTGSIMGFTGVLTPTPDLSSTRADEARVQQIGNASVAPSGV